MIGSLSRVRFALRSVAATPGQTTLAVLALGLGIGLTSTVFSIVYGTTIKGLPFERSDRLMVIDRVRLSGSGDQAAGVSNRVHQLADWDGRQRSFEPLGAFAMVGVNLSDPSTVPERVPSALISPNVLGLLGVRPQLGRAFLPSDASPGAPRVALIGHHLWKNRFGGDPRVIGRVVRMNGQPTTIVGVMPERFGFPLFQALWLPLETDPIRAPRGQGIELTVFGRLRDGSSIESARAEFAALTASLAGQHPREYGATTTLIRPYWRRFLGPDGSVMSLWVMLGAVFGVLLVACANVANLLLARAVVRSRELAVRVALGASRPQVVGQILAESVTIALAGGVLGLGVAWAGLASFRRAAVATRPPFWMEFTLNAAVVAFVVALVVVAGLAAGLVPALRASRPDLSQVLNDEARGSSSVRLGRFSRFLVAAQLALSMAVLLPSASAIKAIVGLETRDFGFAVSGVITGLVSLPAADYADDRSRLAFCLELERRVSEAGIARSAALASALPGETGPWLPLEIEGREAEEPGSRPGAQLTSVTPAFFRTYDVAPLEGRGFLPTDVASSPQVAVVNHRFAERFFPDGVAIGRRIRLVEPGAQAGSWRVIVGVVPDLFVGGARERRGWGVYVPLAQHPSSAVKMVVRSTAPPEVLGPWMRRVVAEVDQGLPVGAVQTMEEVIFQATWATRLFGALFASFGVTSLLMAVVGLYGVVAFATRQRAREFGIRLALGSTPGRLVSLILRQGLWPLLAGLTLGVAGGLGVSSLFGQMDSSIPVVDPAPLVVVLGTFAAATLAAHVVPALRILRSASALRG